MHILLSAECESCTLVASARVSHVRCNHLCRGDISEVRTQPCVDIMRTGVACRRIPSRCRLSSRSLCHWMASEHIAQSGPSTPPPSVSQAIWALMCVVGVSSVCHHVGLMFRTYQRDREVGDASYVGGVSYKKSLGICYWLCPCISQGCIDFVAQDEGTGSFVLFDWKRSKAIGRHCERSGRIFQGGCMFSRTRTEYVCGRVLKFAVSV